jgi:D-3-phosphoglycerate dehydrogenase
MTVALVAAPLTPAALAALETEFGWDVLSSPGLLSADGVDPQSVGVLIVEAELVDREVLDRFPALTVVGCVRGNPVNVDMAVATERGVVVLKSPGRNAESVADHVFGLTLSALRHIAFTHHLVVSRVLTEEREETRVRKDVVWRPSDPTAPVPYRVYKGPELATLTMGLLGFGVIGRRVGAKAVALGMPVLAHDPFVSDAELVSARVVPVSFEQLLQQSDVLSLHAPGQSGPPLIGERELVLMKPTAYVINTARASVLDYDALTRALQEGKLAGAGLDVFPDEPLSSGCALLDLPNVTLTPHIGGASTNVVEHQSEILLESLRGLAQGHPDIAYVENPEVVARCPGGIPGALSRGQANSRTGQNENEPQKVTGRGESATVVSTREE